MTTPPLVQATVAAAAVRGLDLGDAWANRARGRDGWPQEPAFTDAVVTAVCEVIGDVVAGLDPGELRRAELTVATLYGMGRVAEVIDEQLRLAGPRWLEPTSFGYYSPHAVLSAAALAHGLAGPATTLLGRYAGAQALRHVVRRLTGPAAPAGAAPGAGRRPPAALLGGYEAMTAFAVAALSRLGTDVPPRRGDAVAVLLRAGGAGRQLVMTTVPTGAASAVRAPLAAALAAAGAERVATVWAPTTVDDRFLAQLLAQLPDATARPEPASPAVWPLRALAMAVAEPTASLLVVPAPRATTLVVLA